MIVKKSMLTLSITMLLILGLVACSSATPTTSPNSPTSVNPAPTGPTETSIPTSTIAPTDGELPTAPPIPTTSGTNTTPTTAAKTVVAATQAGTANATAAGGNQGAGSTVDKYAFVSQNYADNYQVRPGRSITITWVVKNVGTVGWTTDYTVRHFGGVSAAKEVYNLTKTVPAEGTIPVSVTFVTPATLGTYSTWWKLTNAQGQNFGDVDFTFTVTNNPVAATKVPATAVPATKAP
jgi:hypothetical protein